MKRGLVIGKFMPIHNGHIALINFAAAQCDELIVSMSFTPHDPINAELRFSWIQQIFQNQPNIIPAIIADDFDNDALPLIERTNLWAIRMGEVYPKIDILFSSEDYGIPFATNLDARHILFDQLRSAIPVSATLVRNAPFKHWQHIPDVVKPYFVKKVCFYGPESTGKSTLAEKMAKYYHTVFVPEVARELITSNDITIDDIIKIGQTQTNRVKDKASLANKIVFCDTDLITTKIYAQYYLNQVPDILNKLENEISYDLYFLLDIDVAWVADHLRDFGERRLEMFNLFKSELDKRGINYILINGNYEEREEKIIKIIDAVLM